MLAEERLVNDNTLYYEHSDGSIEKLKDLSDSESASNDLAQ